MQEQAVSGHVATFELALLDSQDKIRVIIPLANPELAIWLAETVNEMAAMAMATAAQRGHKVTGWTLASVR